MKTIGFKPENFDLLLKGPEVKSTIIMAGDKTKRFHVGERIEAVCKKNHRAVECEVTRIHLTMPENLDDHDAQADGFATRADLICVLKKLNPRLQPEDDATIIGLRVVGDVRDTFWEDVPDSMLMAVGVGLAAVPCYGRVRSTLESVQVEQARRGLGVQA